MSVHVGSIILSYEELYGGRVVLKCVALKFFPEQQD